MMNDNTCTSAATELDSRQPRTPAALAGELDERYESREHLADGGMGESI